MRNHGRDPCGVRTQDPEVARQTPYPLGRRSPCIVSIENYRFLHNLPH